jgi:hypothetical protein
MLAERGQYIPILVGNTKYYHSREACSKAGISKEQSKIILLETGEMAIIFRSGY